MMELYASGFNACSQLRFNRDERSEDEPSDILQFESVLSGEYIEKPVARLSQTLVRCNGVVQSAGLLAPKQNLDSIYISVFAGNGDALLLSQSETSPAVKVIYTRRAAETGSTDGNVKSQTMVHPVTDSQPKQVAAFAAGFAILYEDGTVATMGDPRYPECLGREVTPDMPADKLARVAEFDEVGDPVVQISAGGYAVAALTKSGSIYAQGREPPGTSNLCPAFSDLQGFPNYVEVSAEKDIQDFGLGESHAIALTTEGEIYVVGDNSNGQLGIQGAARKAWTKLSFMPPAGQHIVSVSAGPRCSFILTESHPL